MLARRFRPQQGAGPRRAHSESARHDSRETAERALPLHPFATRKNNRMATMVQAVRMALHYGEEHLGVTDVFGEDVGPPLGGVFTATQGLKTAWNSPHTSV